MDTLTAGDLGKVGPWASPVNPTLHRLQHDGVSGCGIRNMQNGQITFENARSLSPFSNGEFFPVFGLELRMPSPDLA